VLGSSGHVLWRLGVCMAVCNVIGAAIGSRMALKHGNRFIRTVFLVVVALIEVKLVYDTIRLYV
ncbi:MAG: sulfite exporter TauE/SafE family protein, partial [Propionibacteriaceae bacterium]|nr:sulfite exporter TauE/SafE family protein [Propionibacteriaceae bacterium]